MPYNNYGNPPRGVHFLSYLLDFSFQGTTAEILGALKTVSQIRQIVLQASRPQIRRHATTDGMVTIWSVSSR